MLFPCRGMSYSSVEEPAGISDRVRPLSNEPIRASLSPGSELYQASASMVH
jgi:hypothetical protein